MKIITKKKNPNSKKNESGLAKLVGPLGLEPRLFWTKTRRVASYTMGHYRNSGCKFNPIFLLYKFLLIKKRPKEILAFPKTLAKKIDLNCHLFIISRYSKLSI